MLRMPAPWVHCCLRSWLRARLPAAPSPRALSPSWPWGRTRHRWPRADRTPCPRPLQHREPLGVLLPTPSPLHPAIAAPSCLQPPTPPRHCAHGSAVPARAESAHSPPQPAKKAGYVGPALVGLAMPVGMVGPGCRSLLRGSPWSCCQPEHPQVHALLPTRWQAGPGTTGSSAPAPSSVAPAGPGMAFWRVQGKEGKQYLILWVS